MREKYNGNIRCEASKVDGMLDDCGDLADWKVDDQYFCDAHKNYFAGLDMITAESLQ